MKQTIKNLTAIAMISFIVSFATGMSASLMYQEHQTLKPFIAAQEMMMDAADLMAETDTVTFDFS
ncbi:hypothetical protein [Anaerotignum sp.]|nr:hypothetical protein [Anaerotignum sp.]MBQ7758686.1 hypothetical protein [Anaerotignum sp.]